MFRFRSQRLIITSYCESKIMCFTIGKLSYVVQMTIDKLMKPFLKSLFSHMDELLAVVLSFEVSKRAWNAW